jgi:Fe-S-cluster containining protein
MGYLIFIAISCNKEKIMTKTRITQEMIEAAVAINTIKMKQHQPTLDRIKRELGVIINDGITPVKMKLVKIYKIKDEMIDIVKPMATACKEGCSNCCRMAVCITSIEAKTIADYTGVNPELVRTNPNYNETTALKLLGHTCPFLRDNRCSIYPVRPMVCQTHFNVSGYAEVCDVIEYKDSKIPNLDFRHLWFAEIHTLRNQVQMDDLRSFFLKENVDAWWEKKNENKG